MLFITKENDGAKTNILASELSRLLSSEEQTLINFERAKSKASKPQLHFPPAREVLVCRLSVEVLSQISGDFVSPINLFDQLPREVSHFFGVVRALNPLG